MARRERTLVERVIRFFEGGGRWTKGAMYRRGCYCLAGAALHCAGLKRGDFDPTIMDSFARDLGFKSRFVMYLWNDDPKRTRRQVMRHLYEARDRERAARKAAVAS